MTDTDTAEAYNSDEVDAQGVRRKTPARKSDQQKKQEAILRNLAELGGGLVNEDQIVREGTRIVIPETMDTKQAIRLLEKKLEADEEETMFDRVFKFRPWDGAHATQKALFKAFGVVNQAATFSFFGKNPPSLHTINVDYDETAQVPWGKIEIPHLKGVSLYLGSQRHPEFGTLFQITAEGPRKFRAHIEGIFKLIQNELEENSIYRGKAFDGQEMPEFLALDGVDPNNVIYSEEVMSHLDANLWFLVEHSEQMRTLGLPLKRAVLLEGPYGTGKTLAAYLTAQKAVVNGWTFIYCRPGKDDLEETMQTAALYQPSIVFYEDVDTVTDGEQDATRMLNVFDGINAKGTEILCVLTTNHGDKIHKGMLRPGRLDAVIHIAELDLAGVQRLTQQVIPAENLAPVTDPEWDDIFEAMEGFMPAFVKEAVDRAVRYALADNGGVLDKVTPLNLLRGAQSLRPQLDLMNGASDKVVRPSMESLIAEQVKANLTDGQVYLNQGDGLTLAVKD